MAAAHTGPVFFRGPVFEPVAGGDPAAVAGHRVTARLGAGPGHVTYLAHAPGGQPVVLTVYTPGPVAGPEFAARFHRAAQAAAQVREPHTVPLLGSGREGDRYWTATPYVPALSLRAAVEGGGPLPTGVVLRLVAGLAQALQAVHHAGGAHGGLRPSHVLLAQDGPRLTALGPAWLGEHPQEAPSAGGDAGTAPDPAAVRAGEGGPDGGDFALEAPAGRGAPEGAHEAGGGTAAPVAAEPGSGGDGTGPAGGAQAPEPLAFRSPEQAAGRAATPATDVFALGQIAAYASIGRPPFGDGSRVQQAEPDLNELPGELREIVTRCLIKDPALRPSTAQILTMCGQAAPQSAPASSWLPPALTSAVLATVPPPPSVPPRPRSVPPGPAQSGAGRGASGPAAAVAGGAPTAHPGAPVHAAPAPSEPRPGLAPPPVPGPPGPPPGAFLWHPQQWPRAPYVHVPLPLPRRRRSAAGVVAVVALAAVTATVAVVFGRDGGSSPPSVAAPAPTAAGSTPGEGATPPATDGSVFTGLRLPAGDALSLGTSPPTLHTGTYDGDLGLTPDGDAFVVDDRHGLVVLGPGPSASSGGPAVCRGSSRQPVRKVDRAALTEGSRVCVLTADGSLTALVTFRQLPSQQGMTPSAVLDLTVWQTRSTPVPSPDGTGSPAGGQDAEARRDGGRGAGGGAPEGPSGPPSAGVRADFSANSAK